MELEINKALLSGAIYLASHNNIKDFVLEYSTNINYLIGEIKSLRDFFSCVVTVPDYSGLPLPEGIPNYTVLRKKINMYKKRGIGRDNIDYDYYVSKIDELPLSVSDKLQDGRFISIEERAILNWYIKNVDFNSEIINIENNAKNTESVRKILGIPYYKLLKMNSFFSFVQINDNYKNSCNSNRKLKEYLLSMKKQCETLLSESSEFKNDTQNNEEEILYDIEGLTKLVADCNFKPIIIESIEQQLINKFKTYNSIRDVCMLLDYCNDVLTIEGLFSLFGIETSRVIKFNGELSNSIKVGTRLSKETIVDNLKTKAECFGKVTKIIGNELEVVTDIESFISLTKDLDSLGFFGLHEQSFNFCKYNIKYLQGSIYRNTINPSEELIRNTKIMLADINSKLSREVF